LRRRSAGIIPYRQTEYGPEFLLLFNLFFEQWQFPRGGVSAGETDLQCARREFVEETGLAIRQLHEDCRVELHYTANIRDYAIERTLVYYLAEVDAGEISFGDEDHCEARWVGPQEAWELLTETGPEQLPALDSAVGYLQGLPQRSQR
jgi:8-oxo-dGTP pyrophosphatase MutT (NUDIX family)